ncbi:VWA domain-containing protein [Elusimicrobiota bacterium]
MNWDYPVFLFIIMITPLIAVLLFYRERRKRLYAEGKIKTGNLIVMSWKRLIVKRIIFIAALIFILLSMAGPRWGRVWQKIISPAKDVIFVIDTSVSMQAKDIEPSRMEAARDKVRFIVENMAGVRAGIVFFAGTAFLQCPVTFDKQALKIFLNEAWDNLVPLPGSNINEALMMARDSFPASKEISQKYIILITDGEELQGSAAKAAGELKDAGVRVLSYGLGTEEGSPIPVYSKGQLKGYKEDKKGDTVLSSLNAPLLRELARETGGAYINYSRTVSDADRIMEIIQKGAEEMQKENIAVNREYRYQYPLLIALILLLIEFIISERRKR